jgi:hypothetical protein
MLLSLGNSGTLAQTQKSDTFRIQFKTHQFVPAPKLEIEAIRTQRAGQPDISVGQQVNVVQPDHPDMVHFIYLPLILGGQAEKQVHFLIQFVSLPDFDDRQQFASQGINLIAYVTGNTYIASAGLSKLSDVQNLPGVHGPALQADDKIGPDLKAGNVGSWSQTPGGREILTIQFHQDVNLAQGEALVAYFGGDIVATVPIIPAITAIFAPGQAQQIAQQDIVQYVDAVDLPLEDHNDGARAAANVTPLAQHHNLTAQV